MQKKIRITTRRKKIQFKKFVNFISSKEIKWKPLVPFKSIDNRYFPKWDKRKQIKSKIKNMKEEINK